MLRNAGLLLIAVFGLSIFSLGQSDEPVARAFVELTASKTRLTVGECSVLRMSFNVYDSNRVPIHFYDLGSQVSEFVQKFSPPNTLTMGSWIENVEGQFDQRDTSGGIFTRYAIYEAGVCPTTPGTITIPSVTLKMKQIVVRRRDTVLFDYHTKPIVLRVSTFPNATKATRKNGWPAVGSFKLKEILAPKQVCAGEPFIYSMVVGGSGTSATLFPSSFDRRKFDIDFVGFEQSDSAHLDKVYGSRKIKFEIVPRAGTVGTFDIGSIIGPIRYFNSAKKSIDSLVAHESIVIKNTCSVSQPARKLPSDTKTTFLFLIDVSQSMLIEDYKPWRLEYLKKQLQALADKGYSIEPILFSGEAMSLNSRLGLRPISDIRAGMTGSGGTAIGDAVVYAIDYAKVSGRNYSKKIFIAGDGDATAGSIPVSMAAKYAAAEGFSITSIGIGTEGEATFGHDAEGKPFKVANTFRETDLRLLASKTNGTYVRLAPKGNLLELLTF